MRKWQAHCELSLLPSACVFLSSSGDSTMHIQSGLPGGARGRAEGPTGVCVCVGEGCPPGGGGGVMGRVSLRAFQRPFIARGSETLG